MAAGIGIEPMSRFHGLRLATGHITTLSTSLKQHSSIKIQPPASSADAYLVYPVLDSMRGLMERVTPAMRHNQQAKAVFDATAEQTGSGVLADLVF